MCYPEIPYNNTNFRKKDTFLSNSTKDTFWLPYTDFWFIPWIQENTKYEYSLHCTYIFWWNLNHISLTQTWQQHPSKLIAPFENWPPTFCAPRPKIQNSCPPPPLPLKRKNTMKDVVCETYVSDLTKFS